MVANFAIAAVGFAIANGAATGISVSQTFDAFTMTYPRFEAFTLLLQAGGRARLTRVWPLLVTLALPVCVAMLDAQPPQVATVGLTPGWATFGQALPQGAATNGLQVGNLATQTDVKNTWPDGSIRFAIVTVKATTAGTSTTAAAARLVDLARIPENNPGRVGGA